MGTVTEKHIPHWTDHQAPPRVYSPLHSVPQDMPALDPTPSTMICTRQSVFLPDAASPTDFWNDNTWNYNKAAANHVRSLSYKTM